MKKFLLVLLCFFVFTGCISKEEKKSTACTEDNACIVGEEKESGFQDMTVDESIAFFENEQTGIIYFGFPGCPWCDEVVDILEEVSQETQIPIHYVRTRKGKEENFEHTYSQSQKEEWMRYISSYMSDNEEGIPTLYVPLVVCVENGIAISAHVGTVEDHDAHERLMSEQEIKEVRNIYKKMFNKLKKDVA